MLTSSAFLAILIKIHGWCSFWPAEYQAVTLTTLWLAGALWRALGSIQAETPPLPTTYIYLKFLLRFLNNHFPPNQLLRYALEITPSVATLRRPYIDLSYNSVLIRHAQEQGKGKFRFFLFFSSFVIKKHPASPTRIFRILAVPWFPRSQQHLQ